MKRKLLEKDIERPAVDYAKSRGIVPLKLKLQEQSGWPDRLFVGPAGRVLWIEFKAPGKKATKLQEHRHVTLRALGHVVFVIDELKYAQAALHELIDGVGHFLPEPAISGFEFDSQGRICGKLKQ